MHYATANSFSLLALLIILYDVVAVKLLAFLASLLNYHYVQDILWSQSHSVYVTNFAIKQYKLAKHRLATHFLLQL